MERWFPLQSPVSVKLGGTAQALRRKVGIPTIYMGGNSMLIFPVMQSGPSIT